MTWLKENAPIFFSKTFWGYILSGLAEICALYAWIDPVLMDIIAKTLFTVTSVNVVWKGAKKMAGN